MFAFTLGDLFRGDVTATCALPPLEVLRALFANPARLRPQQTTEQVTERAALEFAALATSLRSRGAEPQAAAHFLMRLLFCLFAEDTGLLPPKLFSRLVESTRTRPSEFGKRLGVLFAAMATGGSFGADDIAHFNGGLFADEQVMDLSGDDLAVLARASVLDWASVEPAIFGTLFERSLDPAKRAQLGAHYTSREDILLIVEPVFMAPLRRRWEAVQAQARDLIAKRDATVGAPRTRQRQALQRLLVGFADEIAATRVLDPACGSGNFLYVALKRLLDLEKEVITFAATSGAGSFFPRVGPEQLRGIEVNPYAHELASVVVWIGYIQWLHDNGFGQPSDPILKPLHTIERKDALLAWDEQGRPAEPEWPDANVIVGNPPFLGGKRLRAQLGDGYVDALFALYDGRVPREVDLVAYWFERARLLVEVGSARRVGLLATQAIRGGANRRVLERIKRSGDIFMAWRDRKWILDGAAVQVSMVGFDDGTQQVRTIDGELVPEIGAGLTGGFQPGCARRLRENLGISFMGVTPAGSFDVPGDQARRWQNVSGNPNGRPNADVLRRYFNGTDVTRRQRDVWIIDFGVDMPEDQAALYELPFEYVLECVKPERAASRTTRSEWWLHERPRPDMRAALSKLTRYIGTSMVAKHRIFDWIPADVLPANLLIVVARDDDYTLGVLHCRPHELWARAMGTQLREAESGSRYTPTTTFETFSFPWPFGSEPSNDPRVQAIADAARDLVKKRDRWLNPPGASEADLKMRTLTNLYNQRPTWLDQAHRRLDEAVLDAYGWPHDLADDEVLARLLALNLERFG